MKKVVVTGANGQLGKCLRDASAEFSNLEMIFVSKEELDITKTKEITQFFKCCSPDFCVNAAAYTNVDKAESEKETAFLINAEAVKNLALVCKDTNSTLLHISTDYVFDGKKRTPYAEEDEVNPINVYGASKLKGEKYIQKIIKPYYILRTSWLYSQYGHNFFKTIVKHLDAGNTLSITTEQVGNPTNANDLAQVALRIINSENTSYGVYHFSNQGEATWYDFAKEIERLLPINKTGSIVKTNHYPTFAKRPEYSILDTKKITNQFSVIPKNWKQSLKNTITNHLINYGKKI